MQFLVANWHWMLLMLVLVGCSAFCSLGEAALFCLRWPDRRAMVAGNRSAQAAESLLQDPERLLTAVLFWNLLVNVLYFSLISMVAFRISPTSSSKVGLPYIFSLAAFFALVILGEMLPKSLGILRPRAVAGIVGIPMSILVRAVDPVMPILRRISLYSRRVLWPGLREEPSLEVGDLERAIQLSHQDQEIVIQEQRVLSRIISLTEYEVKEWMQPRGHFKPLRPPIRLEDLGHVNPADDYVLITEPDSDEIAAALALHDIQALSSLHLERQAQRVFYLPWCVSVAEAFEQMQRLDNQVAAIVNELGETIGVLTLHDILDSIFAEHPHRSDRLLGRPAIDVIEPDVWQVAGIVNLKRLARELATTLPTSRHVTLGGLIHDLLQHVPRVGDTCRFSGYEFRVMRAGSESELLVEITLADQDSEDPE